MKKLTYILGVFLFQEIVFRFAFPLPELSNFNRSNYSAMLSANLGNTSQAVPIRNVRFVFPSSPDEAEFRANLNLYGFRGDNCKQKHEKQRILFVGDSFVEGVMAPDGKVMPKGFETAANAAGRELDVINLGIAGLDLQQYLPLIVDATALFAPDDLILVLYANDLPTEDNLRANLTAAIGKHRALKAEYFSLLKPRLLELVEMLRQNHVLPFRWHLSSVDNFQPYPVEERAALLQHVSPLIADAMCAGTFNPSAVNALYHYEKHLRKEVRISAVLEYLRDYLRERHCRFYVVYIPHKEQVSGHYQEFSREYCNHCPELDLRQEVYQQHASALQGDCATLRIPFLDLSIALGVEEEKGNHLYWNYDDHMRGAGYLFSGLKIFSFWRSNSD